jgi:hypothetical protein
LIATSSRRVFPVLDLQSSIANLVTRLLALGTSPEAIGLAVAALASREDNRSTGAIRQARYRERQKSSQPSQTVTERNEVTLSHATPSPLVPPSIKKGPHTPKEITPPLNPSIPTFLAREKPIRIGDFDVFWELYPHKIGKGAAQKSFGKAINRTNFSDMLDGLRSYIATKPPDRPWCNPATWLNQDRWEDKPQNINLSAKPSKQEAIQQKNQRINATLDRIAGTSNLPNSASGGGSLGPSVNIPLSSNLKRGYGSGGGGNGIDFHSIPGEDLERNLFPIEGDADPF